MKNFRNSNYMKIAQGRAEANPRNFSNYSGDSGASGLGSINPLNNTLTYLISNASNVAGTWVVFGHDQYGAGVTANAGCSSGVTVTNTESSALQVARDSAHSPFWISGGKVQTSTLLNFAYNITKQFKSSSGGFSSNVIQYAKFQNPVNNQDKLLIMTPDMFSLRVDGMTSLTGTISAAADAQTPTTLLFTFFLGGRTDQGQVFTNDPVVAIAGSPYPSGQSPVVLQAGTASNATLGGSIPVAVRYDQNPS